MEVTQLAAELQRTWSELLSDTSPTMGEVLETPRALVVDSAARVHLPAKSDWCGITPDGYVLQALNKLALFPVSAGQPGHP